MNQFERDIMMVLFVTFLFSCGEEEEIGFGASKSNKGKDQDTTGEDTDISNPVESITEYDIVENIDCSSVPYVTWDTYMQGMLMTHCQGCHASESPTRYGAPENVYFDNIDDALYWSDRIRIRTLDMQDMPPAGGIFSEDLYLVQVWLECFSMYE